MSLKRNKLNLVLRDGRQFGLKVTLYAPIMDSFNFKKFWRRKSWLIQLQYLIAIFFAITAFLFALDWNMGGGFISADWITENTEKDFMTGYIKGIQVKHFYYNVSSQILKLYSLATL